MNNIDLSLLNSLEFALPWVFLILPLPLLLRFLLPAAPATSSSALRIPFYKNLTLSRGTRKKSASWFNIFLAILTWLLLVISAARPQFIGDTIQQTVSGRSLMMAVDISNSMLIDDMVVSRRAVTRLTAVKAVAGEFVKERKGDRIGLILFGSQAYLQAPLTFDRKTVSILLNEAETTFTRGDTAIGDAIGLAVKRLRNEPEKNRVLILLTDGTNSAGHVDPLKAADLAAQEKVKIYTVGVGASSSDVSRSPFSRGRSDLDETTLKAIAEKTDGRYFRARNVDSLLKIYQLLDEIEPISEDDLSYRPVKEWYFYPLALALFLSALLVLFAIIRHLLLNHQPVREG